MGGEEPGEGRSSLRGNSMTLLEWFKKGGHGTSFFFTPLESPAACSGDENYSFFSEHWV